LPDRALEQAVRSQLGIPTGPITAEDAAKLSSLSTARAGIRSLSGLQCFTALTELEMGQDPISDVTPIRALNQLQKLSLSGDAVSDVTALSALSQLEILKLDATQVSDVTPLMGLSSLIELNLNNSQVRNLAPFQNFKASASLSLSGNELTSASALVGATNVTFLDLSGNSLTDVAPLAALTSLSTLWLNGNPLTSFTPLSHSTKIGDFSVGPFVSDLSDLTTMTGIRTLLISGAELQDLGPLESLPALQSLRIDYATSIGSYAPIGALTALHDLTLLGDTVNDLDFLKGSPLSSLSVAQASLFDLTPLSGLTNLNHVVLSDTQVTDIAPLVASSAFAANAYLDLEGNPIDCTAQAANVSALKARGVSVVGDCP